MDIKYTFLLKGKDNKKFECNEIESRLLFKLFNRITDSSCQVDFKKKNYIFNYNIYYDYECNIARLKISLGKERFNDAKILSYINDSICKNKLRSDYSIIITYDGVSNYFCNRGYLLISEFERKLRELIYIILIKTFGLEWYHKTVGDDLKAKIKEISKGKNDAVLIENALQEMTFMDLEGYLFNPYKEISIDEVIKSKEDINKLLSKESKEDVALLLEKCLPKCLWSRYFENNIGNIQNELNNIRVFRNIISHNKQFYLEDYNKLCKLIQSVKLKIENAINDINNKLVDSQFIVDSSIAYNNIYTIKNMVENSGVMKILEQANKIQECFRSPLIEQLLEQEVRMKNMVENSGVMKIAEQANKIQECFRSPLVEQLLEQEVRMKNMVENSGVMKILEQANKIQECFRSPLVEAVLDQEARMKKVLQDSEIVIGQKVINSKK